MLRENAGCIFDRMQLQNIIMLILTSCYHTLYISYILKWLMYEKEESSKIYEQLSEEDRILQTHT